MQVIQSEPTHGLAPAERYLRALWDARWLYLLIVAAFVVGSVIVTALLPRTYSSQAILSARQAPSLASTGVLYDSVMATALPTNEDRGNRLELVPGRFVKILEANRTVTLAAQDAGVLDASTGVDERQISGWVEVEQVEGTDLIALAVNQPTAEAAKRFTERLVARTIEFSRQENNSADTRQLLEAQVEHAEKALTAAEKRFAEIEAAGAGAATKVRRDRAAMDLDLARKTYVPLRRRLDAVDLLLAEQQLQLYIVDPPTLPIRPSFPRPVLNVSIGLILGILTATLVVIVRSIFSPSGSRAR